MMMGTPEEKIKDINEIPADLPDILNDLDFDFFPDSMDEDIKNDENQKRLRKRIETVNIHFINPPRSGKKLLVLDIDYTIFDWYE